ncbi:MAG: DUF2284 domain-containing protein [Clostridiales bacterium]|nr:DUF2284 domain-containing protein [Clostridiales bacterium]
MTMKNAETLRKMLLENGASRAEIIVADQVAYDVSFRDMCAQNSCGRYGKCHMCPPDVGDIHALIARAKAYAGGVFYQKIYTIEDSFDFEGMMDARRAQSALAFSLDEKAREMLNPGFLHLSVGGCGLCKTCTREENLPCRYPDKALASLEAYGVDVYNTAKNAGMKYVNGENTITYFGIFLLKGDQNG